MPIARVGEIGLCSGHLPSSLVPLQASRLRSLNLSHFRLDVDLSDSGCAGSLAGDAAAALLLGAPIELGLHLSASDSENQSELQKIAVILRQMNVRILRCIIYEIGRDMPSPYTIHAARTHLKNIPGIAEIGAGTPANFTELNRNRPAVGTAPLLAWPVNPQRHAGDSLTLIENLAAQRDTVLTARSFALSARFAVGPVTFHRIPDPATAGKNGKQIQPVCSDSRQQELLGAVWTLGSLKYLLESGVDAATYFEAAGPRGVMEHDRVFPLYHVLADVMEFSAGEVLTCADPEPLRFIGLFLRHGKRRRFIVANLLADPQSIEIAGLNGLKCVGGFRLDPATMNSAMHEPEDFRLRASRWTGTVPETLNLPAYSIARFDLAWKE